ncbi:MAG TPA: hypothetical protein VGO11_16225 [Chthoniobacteraceae bacterium]|jgi:hypothetical protein|nr:hypothetical protein [Chthoniobacteraceae bacterium]
MSFTATVEKDVIRLPKDTHLPDGSTVRIELVATPKPAPSGKDWIARSVGVANSGLTTDEIMKLTRGEE